MRKAVPLSYLPYYYNSVKILTSVNKGVPQIPQIIQVAPNRGFKTKYYGEEKSLFDSMNR